MDHREILTGRYCDILKGLRISDLVSHLTQTTLLTPQEQAELSTATPEPRQRKELASILALRGIESFSKICSLIKKFKSGSVKDVDSRVDPVPSGVGVATAAPSGMGVTKVGPSGVGVATAGPSGMGVKRSNSTDPTQVSGYVCVHA